MKKNKILYTIIMVSISIIMCTACVVSATTGLPNLDDSGYAPQITSGKATTIISNILGVLTVVGIIAIVVAIALIAFESILGSASEKAESKGKYVGLVIAAGVITGGSIIARMIISVAETL